MMTCSECVHHSGAPRGPEGRRECRANAPMMGIESHQHGKDGEAAILACWPLTLPSDGCGQFVRRKADIQAATAEPIVVKPEPIVEPEPVPPTPTPPTPRTKAKDKS